MPTMPKSLKSVVALLFVIGIMSVPSLDTVNARAQDDRSQQQAVSLNDLETFAKAYAQVTRIYTVYEHRISKVSEPEQAMALQQEGNRKMNQAVRDHGLSIEGYNAIYRAIESDSTLQKRFAEVLAQNQ